VVTLLVTDNDNATDAVSQTVAIGPLPVANFTFIPTNPNTSTIVYFIDTSTDNDGVIISWWWDFGDQYYSSLQNPQHCYTAEGVYTVTLTVTDNYGLTNSTQKTITVNNGSNNPPYTPNNPLPTDNATEVPVSNVILWWDGGDPDVGDLVGYFIYFGTTPYPPLIEMTFFLPWNYTRLDCPFYGDLAYNTKYYWKIVAEDFHGASAEGPLWSFTTIMDTTPPLTNISFQGTVGDNRWYVSPVLISFTATDNQSGVSSTFYAIDGGAWMSYTTPFMMSTDGIHTISYFSIDIAGNGETPKTATLKIDQVPPVTVHNFSGFWGYNGWYISLTPFLYAFDNTSGVNHTYYTLHAADPWTEYGGSPIVIADGTYELYYYSVDKAGNVEQVKGPFPFKLDMTRPSITLTATPENLQKTKWLLNATAFDATSGMNKVEFFVDYQLIETVYAAPYELYIEGSGKIAYAIAYDNAGNSQISPIVTCQALQLQASSELLVMSQQPDSMKLVHLS